MSEDDVPFTEKKDIHRKSRVDYFQHSEFRKSMADPNEDGQKAGGQTGLQLTRAGQEMFLMKLPH